MIWGYKHHSSVPRSVLLLALLCVVPFLNPYHDYPLTSFYTEWLAVALCSLLIMNYEYVRINFTLSYPAICLLGAGFYTGLQPYFVGFKHSYTTAHTTMYFILAAFLLCISADLMKYRKTLPYVCVALLLGGLINVCFGVYQYFNATPVFGALAQANNYADYLALSCIALLYLCFKDLFKQWTLILLVPLCGLMLLSGSRASLLYVLSVLILSLWYRLISFKWVVCVSAAVLYVLFLFTNTLGRISDNVTHLIAGTQFDDTVRLSLWAKGLDFFFSYPLFGIGFGNYVAPVGQHIATHAHNLVIQLLAEAGIVGCSILLIGAWSWVSSARLNKSLEDWFMLCVFAILLIHSAVELPLWYANFLFLFVIAGSLKFRSAFNVHFRGFYWSLLLPILCVFSIYSYISKESAVYKVILIEGDMVETIPNLLGDKK